MNLDDFFMDIKTSEQQQEVESEAKKQLQPVCTTHDHLPRFFFSLSLKPREARSFFASEETSESNK
jgi:hypothetical protein